MEKREPEEREEKRGHERDPRWFRLLIATLTAVAAIATCVEQLARL
ncbi:hypothetical protein SMCF_8907 [Streptomyces coelicoflavus ZG0656]|jgi:hypothetical protein|nr:hypothetical protein SMCF_8907 [Streptomyces coelicoflavus ZG0656]MZE43734.1 hypothetical protein [Streptomyces sp. SID5477]